MGVVSVGSLCGYVAVGWLAQDFLERFASLGVCSVHACSTLWYYSVINNKHRAVMIVVFRIAPSGYGETRDRKFFASNSEISGAMSSL